MEETLLAGVATVNQLLLAVLRSTETVKIAFRLSILAFFVNCGLDYLLISGNFGAPALGVRGAAIGTLAAQGLWGLNTALQTVILGHMTAIAIAANSIASTLFLLVKSSAVGAASAASVIIGKTVGAGMLIKAKEYSRKLQRIFIVIGILSGIFLFFLRILRYLSVYLRFWNRIMEIGFGN